MTLSATETNELKRATVLDGILDVVQTRWSPRSFADREVNPADLAKVFEAAHWAPSSNNEQPWSYLVGVRGSSTHEKITSTLMGFNQTWAPKAPVLILGMARTKFSHNGSPNYYALYDLGAATAILVLQATALGLATHQMGGYDKEAAREGFQIPEEYALGSVMALGYQGEPAELANEKLIATETTPRTRKPLNEIVFSAWGEAAKLV